MDDTHPFFARRLRRHQLVMLDLAAGMCFSFTSLTVSVNATALPPWMRIAIPLGLGLPLAVRRLWPLPVFCFTLVVAVFAALVDAVKFAYLAPAYALYVVALSGRLGAVVPTSAIVGGLSVVSLFGLTAAGAPRESAPGWLLHLDQPLIGIAALGGAWTVGRAMQERRFYAARDTERLAAQAVTEERLRIARELHDVVTHSVGLIAVKAGVANHVMATRPDEAHDALRVIETASRSALVEMRHLLGVLRSTSEPDLVPAPGLTGIQGLVEQARLAGIEVRLQMRIGGRDEVRIGDGDAGWRLGSSGDARLGGGGNAGIEDGGAVRIGGEARVGGSGERRKGKAGDLGRLPEGVEVSAYRIVQEALTNVIKHAPRARCRVSVVADGKCVRIEVVDDGPGRRTAPSVGTGHGLIGMRERVMMYGGEFDAGSLPGRGFRVFAALPYEEVS
ncbi:sensor histidine kinase [Nonomuraea helvata]|uniref:histidine kinase n=1 Tax=Nonomuraea helvata TaxID=37484 RepID=A0ABV5S0V1_9ACTN